MNLKSGSIATNEQGLPSGREFEKQKLNNIMKLISDIQLKLQGQALIAANPLLSVRAVKYKELKQ